MTLPPTRLCRAGQIGFGKGQIGFRLLQAGARLIERGLERPAIDGEEQIALGHYLPVLEMNSVEVARHPCPDFDGIDGHETADILVLIDNGFGLRPSDGHLRR